ncbi:MAG TPA: hypothetical protein VFG21_08155 [Xanthomonadaceae bacterium]|nr:hypothetical protein [Xanthomonadaceae bacterium]
MSAALAALVLAASTAPATAIEGVVELTAQGRALRPEAAREAVVYFRPREPEPVTVPAEPVQMRTRDKQFEPRVLAVPVGATVRFPNMDPILHNVFSPAGRNGFDLGLLAGGTVAEQTFAEPGLVRVFCNVHHDMVAYVLVLDTPHVTRPDAQGRFRLELPTDSRGDLYVWHERARVWRRAIVATPQDPLKVRMELDRPRVPRHMNKFGRPYGDGTGKRY